ncbi:hypothetical protein KHA90_09085 [Flavobacterium psychroterrae]|uniref:BON domain-containing protein n=1 Tax=Flavobacterium psychroterrae TaxID=2133767 RepID=A0ABS5PA78_9FLAO|nr:hypothetical protein [Flavobacterium psychroterrae]MBS7231179.1 hypothetical protein [Flavobacterium psychroterrae]
MAIIKQAKNITVTIAKNHFVMAGEIERTAETTKIVATYGNIELNSVKKIVKNGNIG